MNPDPLTQLRHGSIEYAILALLRDHDRYGLELTRLLAAMDGLITSGGTIYPLLARLRREGKVTTRWSESRHGPPRRYCHLTEAGRDALEAFAAQWRQFRDAVDGLIASGGDPRPELGDRPGSS